MSPTTLPATVAASVHSNVMLAVKSKKVREIVEKGITAFFVGMLVVVFGACGIGDASAAPKADAPQVASNAAPGRTPQTATISTGTYQAIAKATLPASATASQLISRVAAVREFIESNGGDVIYQKYLSDFGAPAEKRKWFSVQTTSPSTMKLGYYYLTHPLTSAEDTIWFDCIGLAERSKTSPTLRALCALDHWNAYVLTGDSTYAATLVDAADSLVKSSANGQFQWTSETIPAFGIKQTPWISALTQSVGISVLLRAYQYTGEPRYMSAATAAYRWLTVPVRQGGLQSADIGTWLEEYPNQNPAARSGHVLNGNIWALFGVWDYYRVTGDSSAKAIFNNDVAAIKNNMSWYDLGYWNVYSHLNRTDTVNGLYMQFIVQQMYALALITGDLFFQAQGDKWNADQRADALFIHNMAQTYMREGTSLAKQ